MYIYILFVFVGICECMQEKLMVIIERYGSKFVCNFNFKRVVKNYFNFYQSIFQELIVIYIFYKYFFFEYVNLLLEW